MSKIKSALSGLEIETQGELKRRPIHKANYQAPEYIEDENSESEGDSPQKIPRLYPDLKHALNKTDHEPQNSVKKSPASNLNVSKKTKCRKQEPVKTKNIYPSIKQESDNYGVIRKVVKVLLILIIVCTAVLLLIKPKTVEKTTDVSQLLLDMKAQFKNQSPLTFKILKAALKRVVNQTSEPSAPAIISLLADKGAYNTALSFSKHLAQSLAPGNLVLIDKKIYEHGDSHEIKLNIDKEIKSKVDPNSLNVILVDKFEKLPLNSAMIFHSLCDHETAFFKRAVYLFIFSLDEIIPNEAGTKYLDKMAMDHLKKIWKVHADEIDSLITRITGDGVLELSKLVNFSRKDMRNIAVFMYLHLWGCYILNGSIRELITKHFSDEYEPKIWYSRGQFESDKNNP